MVRERIKELVDFATTTSPYRDATKGWINDDVYVQWGSVPNETSNKRQELANVSIYWKPINQIALILFFVVLLASTFVYVAVSFSHGRLDLNIPNGALVANSAPLEAKSEMVPSEEENPKTAPLEVKSVMEPSLEEKLNSIPLKVKSELVPALGETPQEKQPAELRTSDPVTRQPNRKTSMAIGLKSPNGRKLTNAQDLFQSRNR